MMYSDLCCKIGFIFDVRASNIGTRKAFHFNFMLLEWQAWLQTWDNWITGDAYSTLWPKTVLPIVRCHTIIYISFTDTD